MVDWDHPINDGLIGCWIFNTAGGRVFDLAYGQHGNPLGTPAREQSPAGWGVDFNSSSDIIEVPHSSVLDQIHGGYEISIEMLLYHPSTGYGDTWGRVISQAASATNYQPYAIQHRNGEGRFVFAVGNSAISQTTRAEYTTADHPHNRWFHLVVTGDMSLPDMWFYIDGEEWPTAIGVNNSADTIGTNTQPLTFGARRYGGATSHEWYGKIAWVRIWRRALLAAQAAELYERPFDGKIAVPGRRKVFFVPSAPPGGFFARRYYDQHLAGVS